MINATEEVIFEWDVLKNHLNVLRHGVSFAEAQKAFADPYKLLFKEELHSLNEERWFCVGEIETGIITVRFTYREDKIRIFGAGYWRKLRKLYQQRKKSI